MDITSSIFFKGLYLDYLPDIVFINLVLVCLLFVIFSFIRILRRRKRYVDDTVPYMTFLKESLDELVKEAEELRKELSKAKDSATGSNDESEAEVLRFQAMIEEKNEEVARLKEEIVKYEKQEPRVVQAEGDPELEVKLNSRIKELEANIQKAEAEKKDLALKAAEAVNNSAATQAPQDNGKIEELKKVNVELSDKIEKLESQLMEYEIIEDDLANLKLLKEENQKLKAQLDSKGSVTNDDSKNTEVDVVEDQLASTLNQLDEVLKSESSVPIIEEEKEIVKEAEEQVQGIINEPVIDEAKIAASEVDLGVVPDGIDEDLLREFGITGSDLAPEAEVNIEEQNIEQQNIEAVPEQSVSIEEGGELEGKLAEEFEQFMSENQ